MTKPAHCPKCNSEHIYSDGTLWNCPECSYEWSGYESKNTEESALKEAGVRDANGNLLVTGDSITVIKDLKVKGSSSVVKVGMKIKNIRVIESEDGHNIACKIDGVGAINLKSEFVKKV